MNQPRLRIEKSEIDKLVNFVSRKILSPKLSEVSYGIRKYIAERGKVGAA